MKSGVRKKERKRKYIVSLKRKENNDDDKEGVESDSLKMVNDVKSAPEEP